MATPTSNYGFVKDDGTQNYDVAVVNANLDAIDAAIKARSDSITALTTRVTALETFRTSLGYVAWKTATGVDIRGASASAAHAGSSVSLARVMTLGKQAFFYGQGAIGTTHLVDASVMLPNAQTGVPVNRQLEFGTLVVSLGSGGAPADQTYTARMSADKTRIIIHSDTGGFRDGPPNSSLVWFVSYEIP